MARLLPLTKERELETMQELGRLISYVGSPQVGDRLFDLFSQHQKAFESLCDRDSVYYGAIRSVSGRSVLAQYLPVVNDSVLSFNAQCDDLVLDEVALSVNSVFFEDEIGCDGNRSNRFVVRKLPYVAKRFEKRMRLMRMVEQVRHRNIAADATIWDALTVVHFCRKRLPRKCAICILHSVIRGKHDLKNAESILEHYYPIILLNGPYIEIRNMGENSYVDAPTLFLDYVDSTVDLLA